MTVSNICQTLQGGASGSGGVECGAEGGTEGGGGGGGGGSDMLAALWNLADAQVKCAECTASRGESAHVMFTTVGPRKYCSPRHITLLGCQSIQ
jgi:hypothetical protein